MCINARARRAIAFAMADLKKRVACVKAGIRTFHERLAQLQFDVEALRNENEMLRRELLMAKAWQSDVKTAYHQRDSRRKSLSLRSTRGLEKLNSLLDEKPPVESKQPASARHLQQLLDFSFHDTYVHAFVAFIDEMLRSGFTLHEISFSRGNLLTVEFFAAEQTNVHKRTSVQIRDADDLKLIRAWCKTNYIKLDTIYVRGFRINRWSPRVSSISWKSSGSCFCMCCMAPCSAALLSTISTLSPDSFCSACPAISTGSPGSSLR